MTSIIPATTTGEFTTERWAELTQPLRQMEPAIAALAERHGLELVAGSRWPELRLLHKAGTAVTEARLSLDQQGEPSGTPWRVRVVRYPRWAMLPVGRPESKVQEIATLSAEQLADGALVIQEIERAIRELGS